MLDTGRERGVEVELGVRVLGDDGVVNSSEDGGHPLGGRRRRGKGSSSPRSSKAPSVRDRRRLLSKYA